MGSKDLKKAVALKYEAKRSNAPKVVAKGKGDIAKKILEIAKENGIEIYEDPALVEALSSLEINQEIPPRLYEAVAKIIAFVYKKKKLLK